MLSELVDNIYGSLPGSIRLPEFRARHVRQGIFVNSRILSKSTHTIILTLTLTIRAE